VGGGEAGDVTVGLVGLPSLDSDMDLVRIQEVVKLLVRLLLRLSFRGMFCHQCSFIFPVIVTGWVAEEADRAWSPIMKC